MTSPLDPNPISPPTRANGPSIVKIILVIACVTVGGFIIITQLLLPNKQVSEVPDHAAVPPATTQTPSTIPSQNPSKPNPTSPLQTPTRTTLEGRVIDVYPNNTVITVQAASGREEIVDITTEKSMLANPLKQGDELSLLGFYDTGNGIFHANSISLKPTGSLLFTNSLLDNTKRKAAALALDESGMHLEYGPEVALPKPAYLVFLSPEGQILAPGFSSMTAAEYSTDGSLDTSDNALKTEQRITIPFMSRGLWAVKVVVLPGASLSTVMGFDPGLATKSLKELDGKLWYFNNTKLDNIGKIQAALAQCDTACRQRGSTEKTYFLFFGALGDPAIQKKLFGRSGEAYKLREYRLGSKQTSYFTCFQIIQTNNQSDFIDASRLSLYGWEVAYMISRGSGDVCDNGVIDNEGNNIKMYHVVQ